MNFESLRIDKYYNSRTRNIYADFFNQILPQCKLYQRFGGVFSGEKFVQFSYGLQEFIHKNTGTMQLAIIPDFEKEDIEAFREETKEQVISDKWITDLSEIKDKFSENHVKALAWLIAKGKLEIKLILPIKEDETYYSRKELEGSKLLEEIGIFFDKDSNDVLSFRGKTTTKKDESSWINVSRPWENSEEEEINSHVREFGEIWDNEESVIRGTRCKILPLNDSLLDFFKEKSVDVKVEDLSLPTPPSEPRDYQILAVNNWIENDGKGIFEMATGSGKTITAIECLKKLQDSEKKLFVVVTAPYRHLVDQWAEEFSKYNISSIKLEKDWLMKLGNRRRVASQNELTVIICTHAKFNSDKFVSEIKRIKQIPLMVIVDEAHHLGAGTTIVDEESPEDQLDEYEKPENGLIENYRYRIALSATIERYFDVIGTDFLENYFKGPNGSKVIKYGLKEALDDEFLCPYYYHPYSVKFTDEEFRKYKKITKDAMALINSKDPSMKAAGQRKIMITRAAVVREAENKMDAFLEIMKRIGKPEYLLIFASSTQLKKCMEILRNAEKYLGIPNPTFKEITAYNPIDKRDRLKYLREFKNGDRQIILSNKVLDEGLNIPEAKTCIVLASTGNPTQFIQRRGRVLRKLSDTYKDGTEKTHAVIYDVLVKPEIEQFDDDEENKLEKNYISKQLEKINYMSDLAENRKGDEFKEFIENFVRPFSLEFFKND